MSVVWVGTLPESGLFSAVETDSGAEDLSGRFNDLRSRGQGGYIEVRLPNREFPVLTLAFRDDHAVVHLMSDPERTSLLVGDGTVPRVTRSKSRSWTTSSRSRVTSSWISIERGTWCTTSRIRKRSLLWVSGVSCS